MDSASSAMILQEKMEKISHIYKFKTYKSVKRLVIKEALYSLMGYKLCGHEAETVTKILKFPLSGSPDIKIPTGRMIYVLCKKR